LRQRTGYPLTQLGLPVLLYRDATLASQYGDPGLSVDALGAFRMEVEDPLEATEVDSFLRGIEERGERRFRAALLECSKLGLPRARSAPRCGRRRIEHDAAAQSPARRLIAQNEAVAVQRAHRLVQDELGKRGFAGSDLGSLRNGNAGSDIRCRKMQVQRR